MQAVRVRGQVTAGRQLEVALPAGCPAGEVDVILLYQQPARAPRRHRPAGHHPGFGMWRDRPEAQDPAEFAAHLRRMVETGGDRRG